MNKPDIFRFRRTVTAHALAFVAVIVCMLAAGLPVEAAEWHSLVPLKSRRADVERSLEGILEGTVSNNYKLVREAIDRGTTLDQIKPGNAVSTDLKKIVFAQIAAE